MIGLIFGSVAAALALEQGVEWLDDVGWTEGLRERRRASTACQHRREIRGLRRRRRWSLRTAARNINKEIDFLRSVCRRDCAPKPIGGADVSRAMSRLADHAARESGTSPPIPDRPWLRLPERGPRPLYRDLRRCRGPTHDGNRRAARPVRRVRRAPT